IFVVRHRLMSIIRQRPSIPGGRAPMHDADLLARFVDAGDEQAFRELVDRYVGLVYAAARRQVRDSHLAEDVVQTVFITLARKARTVRPRMSLAGWLIETTRFTCRDAMKKELRRKRHEQTRSEIEQARAA